MITMPSLLLILLIVLEYGSWAVVAQQQQGQPWWSSTASRLRATENQRKTSLLALREEEAKDQTDDDLLLDDDIPPMPPPCQPLGQDLVIRPSNDDQDTDDLIRYIEVSLSTDGLVLASGFNVQDYMGRTRAFVMQAYTYVDKLKNWIPFLQPVRVDFDNKEVDAESFSHLQMGSRYIGIGSYTLRRDEKDDRMTVDGAIQLWFMCEESGMGKHRVFWCPLLPLQRPDHAPALARSNDEDNAFLFGVSFDFSKGAYSHPLRVVAGSPRLLSGPLRKTSTSQSVDSSPSVGFIQVYEYVRDFSNHEFFSKWIPVGEPIVGTHGSFGERVKINDQGNIVAVLSTFRDNSDDPTEDMYHCLVYVYAWDDILQQWKQHGTVISSASFRQNRLSRDDRLICTTWAVSEDGSTIVLGPYQYDRKQKHVHGHARVFQYETNKDDWVPKGSDLEMRIDHGHDSLPTNGLFGAPLEISRNGNRVIVTGQDRVVPYNLEIRKTYVFDWDVSIQDWVLLQDSYLMSTLGFLSSASSSSDGKTLAFAELTDAGNLVVIRAYDCNPDDVLDGTSVHLFEG